MIGDSCDMWAGGGVFIVVIGDNDNDNDNCGVCVQSFKCVSSNCVSFICVVVVGVYGVAFGLSVVFGVC